MIVLDASVLIAHLDSTDAHHDAARRVLHSAAGQDLAASVLTVAEVMVGPARDRRGHVVGAQRDAGDVQGVEHLVDDVASPVAGRSHRHLRHGEHARGQVLPGRGVQRCLLYTSDAADE